MLNLNSKGVRKRIGYHVLAFCLGALAPLPIIVTFDRNSGMDGQMSPDPDSRQRPEREAGAMRYVDGITTSLSIDQNGFPAD